MPEARDESFLAIRLTGSILGLYDAVGVQQQGITPFDAGLCLLLVAAVIEGSEKETIGIEFPDFAGCTLEQERGGVAGIGVGDALAAPVRHDEECGDVVFVEHGLQLAVEHVHEDGGACHGGRQGMEAHLEHGGNEGRCNTVARHVGYDEPGLPSSQIDDVVEVPPDVDGRDVPAGETHAVEVFEGVGKQALLESRRHFQLADHALILGTDDLVLFLHLGKGYGETGGLFLHEVPGLHTLHEETFHLFVPPDGLGGIGKEDHRVPASRDGLDGADGLFKDPCLHAAPGHGKPVTGVGEEIPDDAWHFVDGHADDISGLDGGDLFGHPVPRDDAVTIRHDAQARG